MKQIIFTILYLISVLSSVLFSSCGNNGTGPESVVVDLNLTSTDTLTFTELPFNIDLTMSNKFIMINDSVIINVKKPKSGNFMDVYNLHSGKLLSSYFPVGEGPDEMLFCDVNCDGHTIVATDYVRNRFSQFPVDSLMSTSFHPVFINYPYTIGITSHPLAVRDSILLVNPFCYINKRVHINQNVPRFFCVAHNQQSVNAMDDIEFYTQNVGQVNIIRNVESGHIWVLPLDKSEIEIYDSSLTHVKTIVLPYEVSGDPLVSVEETASGKTVCYKDGYPLAFIDAVISPDMKKIYLCLVGKLIGKNDKETDSQVNILVMNWDGEILDKFFVPCYVYSLSVLDSGLYATIEDADENRILVKLGNGNF